MDRLELRDSLLDAYFLHGRDRLIRAEALAKQILSSKDAMPFLLEGKGYLPEGRLLDEAAKAGVLLKEKGPLGEYRYLAFLIRAFLDLSTLSPHQMLQTLDVPYVLSRYQYFHTLSERRVVIHLILRHQQKLRRRNGDFLGAGEEMTLEQVYALFSDALALKEIRNLVLAYDETLSCLTYADAKGKALFYPSEQAKTPLGRSYLSFLQKQGTNLYGFVSATEDPIASVTVRFQKGTMAIDFDGETYNIIPRSSRGPKRKK